MTEADVRVSSNITVEQMIAKLSADMETGMDELESCLEMCFSNKVA